MCYLRNEFKAMRKLLFFISFLLFAVFEAECQEVDSLQFLDVIEQDGDTIPHKDLGPVYVFPKKEFKSKRLERRYWRLARKVKKVYPYAQAAGELLAKYEEEYLAAKDKKVRRKYIKQAEDELFGEYGPQLKKLTISEGRILIKLIDRQTGHTSYELIKDLKGGLSAFFWQGIARLFGNNLKDEYDPRTEDRMIEEIIYFIDTGMI